MRVARHFFLMGLFVSLLFLLSCSKEKVTGGATSDISTLTIKVVGEDGALIPGVEIYLNGGYKGKTSQYGNSKGMKQLVLPAGENELEVKAEGYGKFRPILIRGNNSQEITVVLERKKSTLVANVRSSDDDLADAEVALFKSGRTAPEQVSVTDEFGTAIFKLIADGKYTITAEKAGYRPDAVQREVLRSRDGEYVRVSLKLIPYPSLRVHITSDDRNLEHAQVVVFTKRGYNTPGASPEDAQLTDENGEVVFTNVEYGQPYVLVVKKAGYVAQIVDHTVQMGDKVVQVEMRRDE